jgi:hypothetical protein
MGRAGVEWWVKWVIWKFVADLGPVDAIGDWRSAMGLPCSGFQRPQAGRKLAHFDEISRGCGFANFATRGDLGWNRRLANFAVCGVFF